MVPWLKLLKNSVSTCRMVASSSMMRTRFVGLSNGLSVRFSVRAMGNLFLKRASEMPRVSVRNRHCSHGVTRQVSGACDRLVCQSDHDAFRNRTPRGRASDHSLPLERLELI